MVRRVIGTGCLLAAVVAVLWLYGTAHRPSEASFTTTYGESTLAMRTDRQFVWRAGECAVLQWEATNIAAIWLGNQPTVGSRTMDWCLDGWQSIPRWQVYHQDDSQATYTPFLIQTRRFALWYTALPLIVLGVYALGWLKPLQRGLGQLPAWLRDPFSQGGQVSIGLVLLYAAVNMVVTVNVWVHPPLIAYDAQGHYAYALVLSEGHLPTREESYAFFSPPLPYLIPAMTAVLQFNDCPKATESCNFAMQKAAQYQNVALSLVATFFLLRVAKRLHDDLAFRGVALALVAMLPVYYKSFAFIRGETFVLLFTLVTIDRLIWLLDHPPNKWDVLGLGAAMGLLMLSRQWGALVMVGALMWALVVILLRRKWWLLGGGLAAVLVAFLMSSWFYLGLQREHGSVTAFN